MSVCLSLAIDIHAALTKSAPLRMTVSGGDTGGSYAPANSMDVATIGNWNNYTTVSLTTPGGRTAGGTVFLANGYLVLWGGSAQVAQGNDVFYSTNTGFTWIESTAQALWQPRTDFAYCALPATNIIVMIGGNVANGPGTKSVDTCLD